LTSGIIDSLRPTAIKSSQLITIAGRTVVSTVKANPPSRDHLRNWTNITVFYLFIVIFSTVRAYIGHTSQWILAC